MMNDKTNPVPPQDKSTSSTSDVFVTDRLTEIPLLVDASAYVKSTIGEAKLKHPYLAGTPLGVAEGVTRRVSDVVNNILFDRQHPHRFNRSNILANSAKALNDVAVKNLDVLKIEAPHVFQPTDKVLEIIKSIYAITLRPFVNFMRFWYTTFVIYLSGIFTKIDSTIGHGKGILGRSANSTLDKIDLVIFQNPIGHIGMNILCKLSDFLLPVDTDDAAYLYVSTKDSSSHEPDFMWYENEDLNSDSPSKKATVLPIAIKFWGLERPRILKPLCSSANNEELGTDLDNTTNAGSGFGHPKAPTSPSHTSSRLNEFMKEGEKFVKEFGHHHHTSNTASAGTNDAASDSQTQDVKPIDALLYIILTLPSRMRNTLKRAIRIFDKITGLPSLLVLLNVQAHSALERLDYIISMLTLSNLNALIWEYTKFDSEETFPDFSYYLLTLPSRIFMATERMFVKVILCADRNAITYLPTFLSMRFHNFLKQIIIFRYHIMTAKGDLPALLGVLHGFVAIFWALINPPTPANSPPSGSIDISSAVRDDSNGTVAVELEEKATEHPELWETDDPKLKGIKGAKEVADLIKLTQAAVNKASTATSENWSNNSNSTSNNESMISAAESVLRQIKASIDKQASKSPLKSGGASSKASSSSIPNQSAPQPISINS